MRMPWPVLILAVGVLAVVARLAWGRLPLRSAVRLDAVSSALTLLGVVGLVAHCGAMFYTGAVLAVPGTAAYVEAVNGMAAASRVLYAVPALLVLAGLRRLPWAALAVLALTFVAVGVTMYDGSSLSTHLGAILLSVLALSGCLAAYAGTSRATGTSRPSRTRA